MARIVVYYVFFLSAEFTYESNNVDNTYYQHLLYTYFYISKKVRVSREVLQDKSYLTRAAKYVLRNEDASNKSDLFFLSI
jgi:hypothetical protein